MQTYYSLEDFIYDRHDFVKNKYFYWYKNIIEHARWRMKDPTQILEYHHILPRSCFPDFSKEKWNIIGLTIREHFVCHLLLTKFTTGAVKRKMDHVVGFFMVNKKHMTSWEVERSRKQCREKLKGKVIVKYTKGAENQKNFIIDKEDPRYKSGEVVPSSTGSFRSEKTKEKQSTKQKGMMTAKDKDGNFLRVSILDPRYLSGELIPANRGTKFSEEACKNNSEAQKGFVTVKNKNGDVYRTKTDDPDYISGEVVHVNKGKICPEERKKRISKSSKGMMTAKDKDGNFLRIHKDDPRVISGELIHCMKGVPQTKEFVQKRLRKIKRKKVYITPFGIYGRITNVPGAFIRMCKKSKQIITYNEFYSNKYLKSNYPPDIIGVKTYEDLCFSVEDL